MPLWQWVVDGIGLLLALVLLYGLALVIRRRLLSRSGGTFDLSLRVPSAKHDPAPPGGSGRGWALGVGRYSGDRLEFFRLFSLSPSPRMVLVRGALSYEGQRPPAGPETEALYANHVVVRCRRPEGAFELAMAAGAVTGLLAWLEGGPPGDSSGAFGGSSAPA